MASRRKRKLGVETESEAWQLVASPLNRKEASPSNSQPERLRKQLFALDLAKAPGDMNAPGWRLHPLTGKQKGYWSVTINGNWRLIFRFDGPDAELVDYLDYH
jgi:proteic killer suppression protein